MLEKLINEGFHIYLSNLLLSMVMISFMTGRHSNKKEFFRDVVVVLGLMFFSKVISDFGIYKNIPKGLLFTYGLDLFIAIGLYLYVKIVYKVRYSEILALVYYFVVMATYIIVLFLDYKLRYITQILKTSGKIVEFMNVLFVYDVFPVFVIGLISYFALKWRRNNELNFGNTDEKVLVSIYIIVYLVLSRTDIITTDLIYSNTENWINSFNTISDSKFIISLGVILLTIFNFYFYLRASQKYGSICYNKINDNMKKYTEEYLDKIVEHSEKISKLSHDFNNHMMVIESLSINNKDEISEYIKPLKNSLENLPVKVRSGNNIVDIILNEKISDMEKLGIEHDFNVVVPKDLSINQYDFSSILFNTIDNAIEACKEVPKGKICIEMYPKGKNMVYIIENDFIEDGEYEKTYSLKENIESGFGLKIVNEMVEKYFGSLEVEKKSGKYRLSSYFKII